MEVPEAWDTPGAARPFQHFNLPLSIALLRSTRRKTCTSLTEDQRIQVLNTEGGTVRGASTSKTAIAQWRIVANTRCSRSNRGRHSGCFRLHVPTGRPLFYRSWAGFWTFRKVFVASRGV